MTFYKFNPEQRLQFRAAVTSHSGWREWSKAKGVNSATIKIDGLLEAARAFGIDPANYGQAKSGQPKPRTRGPETYQDLHRRWIDCSSAYFAPGKHDHCAEIFDTIYNKQDRWMTEGQYQALKSAIEKAESNKAKAEIPAPTPEKQEPQKGDPWTRGQKIKAVTEYRSYYSASLKEAVDAINETWPDYPKNWPESKRARKSAPNPAPIPQPEIKDHDMPNLDSSETARLEALRSLLNGGVSESRVIQLVKEHSQGPAEIRINLTVPSLPDRKLDGLFHYRFPLLLAGVNAGVNLMLVGPAGSGKTTAGSQVAELLGLDFHFTGAIDSAYKLSGFIDAQGRFVSTAFYKAFVEGGIFLFDEMDASLPGAVLAFNAALANDYADFPNGQAKRHPNFRAIAACNTFGRGADRQYVGRLQMDAATLDRYAMLEWLYDPALESALIGAPKPEGSPIPAEIIPVKDEKAAQREANRWIETVRQVRAKIETQKIRHVVSPRATVNGAKLLAAGWQWNDVTEAVLYKGLDMDSRAKIAA